MTRRLPQAFDITGFVRPGAANLLALAVVKWSDANYVEDQDQWWMGGVHRDVDRCAAPARSIPPTSSPAPRPDAEFPGRHAARRTSTLGFAGAPEDEWAVEAQLYDSSGRAVFETPLRALVKADPGDPQPLPRAAEPGGAERAKSPRRRYGRLRRPTSTPSWSAWCTTSRAQRPSRQRLAGWASGRSRSVTVNC